MASIEQAELSRGAVGHAAVHVPGIDLAAYHAWAPTKRAFDLVIALGLVAVLLPLVILVAAAVAVTSRGPVLFGQRRVGRDGEPFRCWKFRTMHLDAEDRLHADGALHERYVHNDFKLDSHDDPRLTSIGGFLRRSSLDELPQLFNVVVGSMSLVGPRPVVIDELDNYGPWKDAYLAAKPGITGPWQCSGRNRVRYPERAMLDADYVDRWHPVHDLKILVRTVPAVLRRNGVS